MVTAIIGIVHTEVTGFLWLCNYPIVTGTIRSQLKPPSHHIIRRSNPPSMPYRLIISCRPLAFATSLPWTFGLSPEYLNHILHFQPSIHTVLVTPGLPSFIDINTTYQLSWTSPTIATTMRRVASYPGPQGSSCAL